MPTTITALPDTAEPATGTPVRDGGAWAQAETVWAWINDAAHSDWAIYGLAALLALLLLLSVRSRRKRNKAEAAGTKADLTRTDLAVTRITGILATAVVATGAWKVFGDVLHLHPAIRLVLFFFAEAQIVAAWRRVRRHIYRHATLGKGIRTVYGIAFGSALVAAFDADNLVEVLLRLFAAGVAAYMIAEELAEELDIYLTAHPKLRGDGTTPRVRGRIKWAINLERVLVWLRLAEPTERTVEEVDRRRRIARFARTAYRLQVLKENEAAKWRIGRARWSLRRQTESGNEHLNLASDQTALSDVRAQLALLYGAEAGTSRAAVSDINPLRPAPRLAISATPHVPSGDGVDGGQEDATGTVTLTATETDSGNANTPDGTAAIESANSAAANTDTETVTNDATRTVTETADMANERPSRVRQSRPGKDANPTATKVAKALAKWPDATLSELARRTELSERTVSRHRPAAEAINAAKSRPVITPIPEPKTAVLTGVNGHHPNLKEN